uniref:Ig-like domain-containing protein n=1 Tax=Chelonoidis abingdonii TaxID=106734 RepID=A0A8C0H8B3_CHEAB
PGGTLRTRLCPGLSRGEAWLGRRTESLGELPAPGPSISVIPSGVIAPGVAVTIRCQCQCEARRFLLHKFGNPNVLQDVVLAGNVAEFPIHNVSRRDAGSYCCYYHSKSDPSIWSEPSDPVELVIAGEGYPKPNISLSPSGGVSLGGAVAIWCRRQSQGVRFVLNKEGRHFPPVDSDGFGAVFPISNVSREDGGSYSCSYHRRSEPFTVSYPSDPVELVVRGEGPGSASPFPAPSPARSSRGSVPMGRSEPGSTLSPDPAEGTPGWGVGTESLGVPQP